MSTPSMFEQIEGYYSEVNLITASNGPNDFAVVQSLMFGLEDNSMLTVRFTADIHVDLSTAPACQCEDQREWDEEFEGEEFDAIITRVRKLPGWKQFEIVFSITELPDQGEFIGVYDAHGRTGTFSPFEEDED